MRMVAVKTFVLISLSIFKISAAQSCDSTTNLSSGETGSISWPEEGNSRTWCGYVFKAPVDHILEATLYINMQGVEPSCAENQYVAVSTDNMRYWDGYSKFCGSRSGFVVKSVGNELKLGIAADDFTQSVQVQVTAVPLQQENCDCSWSPTLRIVNGQNAVANEFTSHVTFNAQSSNFCGGTLITQKHAVTAAHCVANINDVYGIANVRMYVGRYNIRNDIDDDLPYSASYHLSLAETHFGYSDTNNDIGLVTVEDYVRLTRGVSPACIPFSYSGYSVPDGTTLTAVGFGSTEFGLGEDYDSASWTLQKVALTTSSQLADDCTENVICAYGSLSSYTRGDTCTRDSGGGVYGFVNNRYYLFASVSRGLDCGSTSSFSYNMYVVNYIDWIKSRVSGSFMCTID